jgi:hypothetical protein
MITRVRPARSEGEIPAAASEAAIILAASRRAPSWRSVAAMLAASPSARKRFNDTRPLVVAVAASAAARSTPEASCRTVMPVAVRPSTQ